MSRNTRVQFAINDPQDNDHDSVTKPRTRRGCITCRTRKVKCDEQRGICKTCARLGLECHWLSSSPHHGQRSRTNRACQRCRQRKMRCHRAGTRVSCSPCQDAGTACLPTITSRDGLSSPSPSGQIPANVPSSTLGPDSLPSRTEMMRLLDAYFNGPHNFCFFTFIHRPTFMQLLDNDLIPRCLLLIVLATIKRIEDPQGKLADSWADESCQLVLQGIFAKISTSYLQALLLLQRYEQHRGAHLKAWFLSGLAIRLAHALQLNIDPLQTQPGGRKRTLPITVVEVRRRLMWSCLVMESMMESGARPLSSMRVSSIDIRLPCDETEFHLGRETETERVNFAKDFTFVSDISVGRPCHGISACAIKVAILRMQTIEYVFSYHPRNQANLPSELPWNPDAQFYRLRRKLDQMTDEVSIFDQNSLYSRSHGELIKLLNLHCLFQGAYCDLLRIGALLTSLTARVEESIFPKPPTWFLDTCGRGLLHHAFSMAQVVSMSMRHLASDCDPFTAVCGCLAARLLVIDRRPEDNDYLSLSDPTVRASVDGAVQCARRVARWSEPVRKYLWALSKLSRGCAYKIDLTDTSVHEPSPSTSSRPASREVSPSLRTYGTFGAIQRNLAVNPDEAEIDITATSKQNQNNQIFVPPEAPTNVAPGMEAPGLVDSNNNLANDDLLQPYSPLAQDALRIAAGWADGTFDLPLTEGLFDSTGVNFAPDFGINEAWFSAFDDG